MADIFISYPKASAALTEQLAQDLRAKGFTVWYDTSLVPGDSFRHVIMSELGQAWAIFFENPIFPCRRTSSAKQDYDASQREAP
jgi:hypothetical protein